MLDQQTEVEWKDTDDITLGQSEGLLPWQGEEGFTIIFCEQVTSREDIWSKFGPGGRKKSAIKGIRKWYI